MKTVDILKGCPPFRDLDTRAGAELARAAAKMRCAEGEMLFSEGDDAEALFVLIEGAVELIKASPEGKEQLVRGVNPGEMFAEAAMFAGETYPVTAIVRKESKLLVITKRSLVAIVKKRPDIAFAMIGTMAKLLRHLNKLLADLSLGSVMSRLAAYLLQRAHRENNNHIHLGMPKKRLAYHLGTIPETLSRNLGKLVKNGIIEVQRGAITIKDINQLEDFSRE